jgi:cytochrome c biogenesis protein ResB
LHLLKRVFDWLTSVAFAIPLLVLIAAASIVGGLLPQGRNVDLASGAPGWVRDINGYLQLNDIFHAWWYLLLLGLLAVSLLAVTIKRVPTVWRSGGRGAAAGIFLAHLGILLIIGGALMGSMLGFRYYARVIEGEVTVLPELPFVIKLDAFALEYHDRDPASAGPPARKRQDSTLTLLRHGAASTQATTAPGRPLEVDGVTLLPSHTDIGWTFSLVVRDPAGREKVVPVSPWAPPLIRLGLSESRVFAHRVMVSDASNRGRGTEVKPDATEVFLLGPDGSRRSLGLASEASPVNVYRHQITPWDVRPYTGLHIYRRPGTPLLIAGIASLVAGLAITVLRRRISLRDPAGERVPAVPDAAG